MSGLVGIACSDQARYIGFYADLAALQRPAGTLVSWSTGPYVPINRNELVDQALLAEAEWLWFLDDDHRFQPDILMRLLAHDADIVVPFVLKREPPFMPVVYVEHDQTTDRWMGANFYDIPTSGTLEVVAAGTGGMLVRRHVLEALEKPWFEMGKTVDGVLTGEDLTFSERATNAGFRILLDVDAPMGHIGSMVVWPSDDRGARIEFSEDVSISLQPRLEPLPV